MNTKTMKELPASERPYERCEAEGAGSLSNGELLAVLLRTGTKNERADEVALRLLDSCGNGGLRTLCGMTAAELKRIPGIGRVKSIQLLCVFELAKRISAGKRLLGESFCAPEDIFRYYHATLCCQARECLMLLVLDSKNRVLAEEMLSVGTVNASIADPREIFLAALRHGGVSIILLHNHPSGDPTPSKEDIASTDRILRAGRTLGIPLLDHLVLGQDSFVSLREEGYLNFLP